MTKNGQAISLSDPSFLMILNQNDSQILPFSHKDIFGVGLNALSNDSSYGGIPKVVSGGAHI